MVKLLLGMLIEVFVAVSLAGLILALAIPFMHSEHLTGTGGSTTRVVVTGVLVGAVALALFRPGSAMHRRLKR